MIDVSRVTAVLLTAAGWHPCQLGSFRLMPQHLYLQDRERIPPPVERVRGVTFTSASTGHTIYAPEAHVVAVAIGDMQIVTWPTPDSPVAPEAPQRRSLRR